MRVPLLCALLLAGCLEPASEGIPPASTPSPVLTSAAPTGTTPTPTTPTPAATPTPSSQPLAPGAVEVRELAFGSFPPSGEPQRVAFTERIAYEKFWSSVREDPEAPPPAVDFARETAVGVVLGQRPDTCWAVRVTNATDDGYGATSVEVTTFTPPPEMMCGMAITFPWHLVALAGADRSVTFTERTAAGPAPS